MTNFLQSQSYLIGIAGGSGSGKTTFIKKLQSFFAEEEIAVISQDNYYKKLEEQYVDPLGIVNFDLPSSLDLESYTEDIAKLITGVTITRPEYTFNNEAKSPELVVTKPAPIVIAEGLFVFCNKKLQDMYDLKIMIDATDDKKIIRRIKRDRIERNYPLEDVLYRYEHHVVPSYKLHIEPFKAVVDIVINNNNNFDVGLKILKGFLESKIKERRLPTL
jgi:uridine kinase